MTGTEQQYLICTPITPCMYIVADCSHCFLMQSVVAVYFSSSYMRKKKVVVSVNKKN